MRCTLSAAVLLVVSVGFAPGCGDDAKPSGSASGKPSSSATQQAATATPEPPKPKGMPSLLVDADGPYIGTERVRMTEADAPTLARLIALALRSNDPAALAPEVAALRRTFTGLHYVHS